MRRRPGSCDSPRWSRRSGPSRGRGPQSLACITSGHWQSGRSAPNSRLTQRSLQSGSVDRLPTTLQRRGRSRLEATSCSIVAFPPTRSVRSVAPTHSLTGASPTLRAQRAVASSASRASLHGMWAVAESTASCAHSFRMPISLLRTSSHQRRRSGDSTTQGQPSPEIPHSCEC